MSERPPEHAASPNPAPTSAATSPTQSLIKTRDDATSKKAYAILTVLESRLQSPFG